MTKKQEKETIAIHEAGHGVAAIATSTSLKAVSIITEGDEAGHCTTASLESRYTPAVQNGRRSFGRLLENEVVQDLAGLLAMFVMDGDLPRVKKGEPVEDVRVLASGNDVDGVVRVRDALVAVGISPDDVEEWVAEIAQKAYVLLGLCRSEIRALAARLLEVETMTGKEVRAFFGREGCQRLRDHWKSARSLSV